MTKTNITKAGRKTFTFVSDAMQFVLALQKEKELNGFPSLIKIEHEYEGMRITWS